MFSGSSGEVLFFAAFVFSIVILPLVASGAQRFQLVDLPGERKVHSRVVPLVGGIGMLLAVLSTCFMLLPLEGMQGFLAGLLVLGAIGVADDIKDLGPLVKFTGQIIAVLLMFFFSDTGLTSFGDLLAVGSLDFPVAWLSLPITVFCALGLINSFNMIDGLDGLAGGLGFIAFLAFAVICHIAGMQKLALFSLTYAGAILGFLLYNWGPASMFMGDAGSLTIGFSLLYVALSSSQGPDSLVRPVSALLILAVPIVDTLTLMSRRIIHGRNPFVADNYHLHHILLRFGFSKKTAVKIILFLAAFGAAAAVVGVLFRIPDYLQFMFFMVLFGGYFISSFLIRDLMKIMLRLKRRRKLLG